MPDAEKLCYRSRCPKGHEANLFFEREALQKKLEDGGAWTFLCHCGESWSPGLEERERIAIWLAGQ